MSRPVRLRVPRFTIDPLSLQHFGFYSLGAALFAAAYGVTFVHGGLGLEEAFVNAFHSVGSAYLLGVLVCVLTARMLRTPWPLQLTCHVMCAAFFSYGWYALIRLGFGVTGWLETGEFVLSGFPRSVLTWQLCQGLVVYALLVCATLALIFHGRSQGLAPPGVETGPAAAPLNRFLTRRGEAIEPVAVEDIILIVAAGDYSEVVTRRGRHLVRILLGEFEERLDPQRFLRVHRSKIINLDQMVSVEPAGGGRMLVHLHGGTAVTVSRSGAQRLRGMLL